MSNLMTNHVSKWCVNERLETPDFTGFLPEVWKRLDLYKYIFPLRGAVAKSKNRRSGESKFKAESP